MFYVLLLVWMLQIVLFIFCVKKNNPTTWFVLILVEVASIVASLCLQIYYNNLPPTDNWMPGFSYLNSILSAGVMGVVSIINLLATIPVSFISKRKIRL